MTLRDRWKAIKHLKDLDRQVKAASLRLSQNPGDAALVLLLAYTTLCREMLNHHIHGRVDQAYATMVTGLFVKEQLDVQIKDLALQEQLNIRRALAPFN